MNNNIYLIGMMGSGKSTIGELLAKNLYYKFIDVDDFIVEHSEYESINEIFEKKGEKFFRTLEKEAMKEISKFENKIVATGGGVILNDENIQMMSSSGLVLYLKSDIDHLVNRLEGATDRPLLKNEDLKDKLNTLYSNRKNLYNKAANLVFEITSKDKQRIIEEILKRLEGDYDEYFSD